MQKRNTLSEGRKDKLFMDISQKKFFKTKKYEALQTAFLNERQNSNLTANQHNLLAYLTKFQNRLTGESESMYFGGIPKLLNKQEYEQNNLEYPKNIAQAFDTFLKSRRETKKAEGTACFDELFSKYEYARDALNVEIKHYLEKIDGRYGTNYLRIAKYGEFKGAATSFKDQRGNALEYYALLKVTKPALTELQHDFVASLAYYRHELHVHGVEFLMQMGTGRDTMETFQSVIDIDVFDRYGFNLSTPMQVAYEALLHARQQAVNAIDTPYLEECIDDFLDKKEWFNAELETFLANVDEKTGTQYSPKCNHRVDVVLAKEKDKEKILAMIHQKPLAPPKPKIHADIPQQPRIDAYTVRSFKAMFTATVEKPLELVGERIDFIDKSSEMKYSGGTKIGTYKTTLQASDIKIPVMKIGDDFFINPETITNVYDKDSFLRYDYHTDYRLIKLPREAVQQNIVKIYGNSGKQLSFDTINESKDTKEEKHRRRPHHR